MYQLILFILTFTPCNDYSSLALETKESIEFTTNQMDGVHANNSFVLVKGSKNFAPFSLINKDGELILRGALNQHSIDTATLSKGIYYVKTMSMHNQPMSYCFAI